MMHSMTFTSLAKRAAETRILDCVADYIGGDDLREVTVFLEHDVDEWLRGGEWQSCLAGKEIIGVALCDVDDPQAVPEILDRDQAVEMFGCDWCYDKEEIK